MPGLSHDRRGCVKPPAKHARRNRVKRLNGKTAKHPVAAVRKPVLFRIRPVVKRYFYIAPHDIRLNGGLVLHPRQFSDDSGEPACRFMDFGPDGYFNLYVNGILQEGNLYKADACKLTIAPTEQSILKGTPIILESVGFRVWPGK